MLLFVLIHQHLRQTGVVGKFVEFFGPGVAHLSIADRATIANMCPEYGATVGFFPVDEKSLLYLRQTGKMFSYWYSLLLILVIFGLIIKIFQGILDWSFYNIYNMLARCGSLRINIYNFRLSDQGLICVSASG